MYRGDYLILGKVSEPNNQLRKGGFTMKFRKLVTLSIIGCMAVGLLTGCGGKKTDNSGKEITGTQETGTNTET